MREMRKEISRLKCIKITKQLVAKRIKQRSHNIKDGLGHKKGAKTNGRKVINAYDCVKFHQQRKNRYRTTYTKGGTKTAPSSTAN